MLVNCLMNCLIVTKSLVKNVHGFMNYSVWPYSLTKLLIIIFNFS